MAMHLSGGVTAVNDEVGSLQTLAEVQSLNKNKLTVQYEEASDAK